MPSDPSTTWIAVGSIGTFGAALATTGVAVITRKLAAATEQSARAARDAVDAMEEPFVIAVPVPPGSIRLGAHEERPPPGIHRAIGGSGGPIVRMRLWNIGTGPAIVERVTLGRTEREECLGELPGGFRPIGAGQAADMEIPSPGWPATLGDGTLRITYTHSSGRRYETTSAASIGDPTVACLTYPRSRT